MHDLLLVIYLSHMQIIPSYGYIEIQWPLLITICYIPFSYITIVIEKQLFEIDS